VVPPREHRSDSLSAAFRNLEQQARDDLTRRSTRAGSPMRTAPSKSLRPPEERVRDVLLLRGSTDFADLVAYRHFPTRSVSRHNARHANRIEAERAALQSLPATRTCN
jgi:hypothetical protein